MVQQVLKMLFCLTKQLKAFLFLFFFRKLFFTKILIWCRVYSRFDNWHWWSPHQRCYRQYTQVFHDRWQLRDNILRYSTIHDNLETIYSGIPRYMTTQRQYTQVFHDTWQLRDNILRYFTIHDRSETIYSGIPRYMTDQR